jgi:predicted dehydrogenase
MKVGIIGCGMISTHHIPHAIRRVGVDNISVCDLDVRRAEGIAKRFGIKNVYTSFDQMQAEQQPDIVHVLTPPAAHMEMVIGALDAGCHVLVEKPMALTLEEADSMIAAARRNNRKLCVDHNFLVNPLMDSVRELAQSGRIGKILHVDAKYHFDLNRLPEFKNVKQARNHWATRMQGGLITDHLPHPVYLALTFLENSLNEPLKLHIAAQYNGLLPNNMADELRVLIDATESTGLLSVSFGAHPDCCTLDLYGTNMTVHINLSNLAVIKRHKYRGSKKLARLLDNIGQGRQLITSTVLNTYRVARKKMQPPGDLGPIITRFYDSIEADTEVPVSPESARAVVEVMSRILDDIDPQPGKETADKGAKVAL